MLRYPTPPQGGGIYILWLSDTHYYGGRARSFRERWATHYRKLRAGKHRNSHLQAVFDQYGRFEPQIVVAIDSSESLVDFEQEWLDEHVGSEGCLNIARQATGGCGPHSEETRRKMREARAKQASPSAETRQKISATLSGFRHTAETRAKMKARKPTPETRKKLSEAGRRRAPPSLETRAKLSAAKRGVRYSKEVRERMSEGQRRRAPPSPETRAKMSARRHSDETKAKMRASQAARRERERATLTEK